MFFSLTDALLHDFGGPVSDPCLYRRVVEVRVGGDGAGEAAVAVAC